MNALKEESGKYSTLRIILFVFILILAYQLYEFRFAYRLEVVKESPDYRGLSLLFAALVTNFIVILITKVVQKKFERRR